MYDNLIHMQSRDSEKKLKLMPSKKYGKKTTQLFIHRIIILSIMKHLLSGTSSLIL